MVKDYIEYNIPPKYNLEGYKLDAYYYDMRQKKLFEKYRFFCKDYAVSQISQSKIIINNYDILSFTHELSRLLQLYTNVNFYVLDLKKNLLVKEKCEETSVQYLEFPNSSESFQKIWDSCKSPIDEIIVFNQKTTFHGISLKSQIIVFLKEEEKADSTITALSTDEQPADHAEPFPGKNIIREDCDILWMHRIDGRAIRIAGQQSVASFITELIQNSSDYTQIPKFAYMGLQEILLLQETLLLSSMNKAIFAWLAIYNDCFGDFEVPVIQNFISPTTSSQTYHIICSQMMWKLFLKYMTILHEYNDYFSVASQQENLNYACEIFPLVCEGVTAENGVRFETELNRLIQKCRFILYDELPDKIFSRLAAELKKRITSFFCKHHYIIELRILIIKFKLKYRGYC